MDWDWNRMYGTGTGIECQGLEGIEWNRMTGNWNVRDWNRMSGTGIGTGNVRDWNRM